MTAYYFDAELGYDDERTIAKIKEYLSRGEGRRPPIEPDKAKIITIQYQKITWGKPVGDLIILKEWESSEEEIIRQFIQNIDPKNMWDFIPVGYFVYFDLYLMKTRAEQLKIESDWRSNDWFVFHDLPVINIRDICRGTNDFRLTGSGLSSFTQFKTQDGINVPLWYWEQNYDKIIDYIETETKAFFDVYSKLKAELPKFREERNFFG